MAFGLMYISHHARIVLCSYMLMSSHDELITRRGGTPPILRRPPPGSNCARAGMPPTRIWHSPHRHCASPHSCGLITMSRVKYFHTSTVSRCTQQTYCYNGLQWQAMASSLVRFNAVPRQGGPQRLATPLSEAQRYVG